MELVLFPMFLGHFQAPCFAKAVRVALERWLIVFLLLAAATAFFTLCLAAVFCLAVDIEAPDGG